MIESENIIIVFCTIDDASKAAEIARTLIEEKLAPCANIIPTVRSIYRWKGTIHDEGESLIVIKTQKSLFHRLEKKIRSLHPYEVPEIIAFDMTDAGDDYLEWLFENTIS
jgi:periplasmic divalent cation tolerance protein